MEKLELLETDMTRCNYILVTVISDPERQQSTTCSRNSENHSIIQAVDLGLNNDYNLVFFIVINCFKRNYTSVSKTNATTSYTFTFTCEFHSFLLQI